MLAFFYLLLLLISTIHSQPLIFILAGQSNMSGRGGVHRNKWDRKIPPESHPSPSILRLNSRLQWGLATEPLHVDIDIGKPCGVGPGLPFANYLVRKLSSTDTSKLVSNQYHIVSDTRITRNQTLQSIKKNTKMKLDSVQMSAPCAFSNTESSRSIGQIMCAARASQDMTRQSALGHTITNEFMVGLVPCAIGGTKIEEWAQGRRLYGKMVTRAKAALRDGGKLAAVVWYQGESDTVKREDAENYKGRMERFVRDVRNDLGDPNLLFIQVALASGEGSFVEDVRKAQLEINLSNVTCVDAKGLLLESDHLHLTTRAQVQLGKMLADAYLKQIIVHVPNNSSLSVQL